MGVKTIVMITLAVIFLLAVAIPATIAIPLLAIMAPSSWHWWWDMNNLLQYCLVMGAWTIQAGFLSNARWD